MYIYFEIRARGHVEKKLIKMKIEKEIEFGRFETGRGALSVAVRLYSLCILGITLVWIDPLEDLEKSMQFFKNFCFRNRYFQ